MVKMLKFMLPQLLAFSYLVACLPADASFTFSAPRDIPAPRSAAIVENTKEQELTAMLQDVLLEATLEESAPPGSEETFMHKATTRLEATDGADRVQKKFADAQKDFDQGQDTMRHSTEDEQGTKHALRKAMLTSARVGQPRLPLLADESTACVPDTMQCFVGWKRKGFHCVPGAEDADIAPHCQNKYDFSAMNEKQKRAVASACGLVFRCQPPACEIDASARCPVMWEEIEVGVCQAPASWQGACSPLLHSVDMMSEEKKLNWKIRCAWNFPCAPDSSLGPRDYDAVCPADGWELGYGLTCFAPSTYRGPCAHMHQFAGLTIQEKKEYGFTCGVSWPLLGETSCRRDYAATCPFGWWPHSARGGPECWAPAAYDGRCEKRQKLQGLSPAEKMSFETRCDVRWPCKECQKTTSRTVCPAGWYTFNGGLSCMSHNYCGRCSRVMHNIHDLSSVARRELQERCAIQWPCEEEVAAQMLEEKETPALSAGRSFSYFPDGALAGQ